MAFITCPAAFTMGCEEGTSGTSHVQLIPQETATASVPLHCDARNWRSIALVRAACWKSGTKSKFVTSDLTPRLMDEQMK